jgi:signal peptidase
MDRFDMASGGRRLPLAMLVRGLGVALALGVLGVALLTRVVPLTGRTALVVGGPSMAPAITVGSALIVEPVDPATLRVGDVVSIKSGPSRAIFTHRIVRIVDRDGALWLETKGDANVVPDPAIVPASDALGRVVAAIPFVGYLVALSSHPSGVVLILALELLLLITARILDPKLTVNRAQQAA